MMGPVSTNMSSESTPTQQQKTNDTS